MYSIAELAERSGGELRAIKFWVEAGALIPTQETDRAGRGVHRKFSRDELIICCVLAAAFKAGAQIGMLKRISDLMRESMLYSPRMVYEQSLQDNVIPVLRINFEKLSIQYTNRGNEINNLITINQKRENSFVILINIKPWLDKIPED